MSFLSKSLNPAELRRNPSSALRRNGSPGFTDAHRNWAWGFIEGVPDGAGLDNAGGGGLGDAPGKTEQPEQE